MEYFEPGGHITISRKTFDLLATKFNFRVIQHIPTQAQVEKWLRDKYNINIYVNHKPNIKKWDFIVYDLNLNGREYVDFHSEYNKLHPDRRFDTKELALDEALFEAINNIK
jgi:hypothetical protein